MKAVKENICDSKVKAQVYQCVQWALISFALASNIEFYQDSELIPRGYVEVTDSVMNRQVLTECPLIPKLKNNAVSSRKIWLVCTAVWMTFLC